MKQLVLAIFSIFVFSVSRAQWTPDPFCPYPYPDHVTRYLYSGNCSVYWECWQGTKYVMECPEGLEFNAPLEQCDAPELANCDPNASTTANPNTPPTFSTGGTTPPNGPECPIGSEDLIYYPVEGDCTKYWECYEGNRYLYSCPPDLWWHQELSQCDYPSVNFCNPNGTTPSPTFSPTISTSTEILTTNNGQDPRCSDSDDNTYWPEPDDCSKYIQCLGGYSYVMACPPNRFFDSQQKLCLSADEADCCQNTSSTTGDVKCYL